MSLEWKWVAGRVKGRGGRVGRTHNVLCILRVLGLERADEGHLDDLSSLEFL
jgi:hypothetical protein